MYQQKSNLFTEASSRIIEINRGKNGYGFTLSGQAPSFVSWVVRHSPAEKIGLSVGDYVISVNGKDVSTSAHESVVKLIGLTSGTLFLGVCGSIDEIAATEHKKLTKEIKTSSQLFAKSEVVPLDEARQSFSRAERVLKDLHSGVIFRSMPSSINGKPRDLSTSESDLHHPPPPVMVVMQSIVAYLGMVEMPSIGSASLERASLEVVQSCVQQLRVEQHIHQRVLMKVTQSCVKLNNADGDTVATYGSDRIKYTALCPGDNRFFCLVASQDKHSDGSLKHFCHVFMVDPDIASHPVHVEKAKRFGIYCTTSDDGDCVEFPRTPRNLLAIIRLLHLAANDSVKKRLKDYQQPGNYNNNSTLKQANQPDEPATPRVHVVDHQHPLHSGLTRGDSSLPPCVRWSWTDSCHKHDVQPKRTFSSSSDDLSRLSPKALFPNDDVTADRSDPRTQSNSSTRKPERIKLAHHQAAEGTTSKDVVALSQANLLRHDTCNPPPPNIPPPMLKMNMGKYRMSDNRYFSGSTGRLNKKSQNVNPSDEDPMSGASSVESLTSNASLPSCINGTLSGSYGYQDNSRASLPTATSSGNVNDITAGRISHWAVSFDRLLDDTLGVKYFREFLRKEFSEENILFWEACEELRRSDGDDEEKLKSNIISIYERFLAPEASMSVNIDSHGQQLAEEALQAPPHPGVFLTQQHQVYTLMRLDSYSRFLKSPLYRQCMVSEMEGRPLPLDSPEWSNPDPDSLKGGSRSIDSGSMHRKSKKAKGSKKGIFSFKNRPKSQREFKSHNSLSRRSSGNAESSGSESAYPVSRTASLPGNSMSFPDPTRVCHVTLWDSSSTVLYPKRGNATVAEALGNLCENRGVRLSALDVYFAEDYAAPSSEGKHKRPLSLDLDVSVLASQSIVLERRSLFRLDMLPVKRSVGVKARPTKTVAEVLRPVLNKYHLKLDHVLVRESVDQKEVVLHQPVSTLDGLKIIVEDKPGETKKDEGVTDKNKQRKKEQTLPRKNRSGNREVVSEKKETEAMLDLMTSLQSSKLNDQRGLISEADLELPDFLKLKPINDNSNNNVACDATKRALTPTSVEPVVEKIAPYAVSPVVNDVSSGHYRLSRLSASGRNEKDKKCYVELNAQHKAMTSFKPPIAPRPSDIETSDDTNDETIVEDPGVLDHQFDPNVTLQPLPTPPRHQWSSGDTRSPPLADYPPPTPLSAKNISHKE